MPQTRTYTYTYTKFQTLVMHRDTKCVCVCACTPVCEASTIRRLVPHVQQAVCPRAELYILPVHGRQLLDALAPVALEMYPGRHGVHSELPASAAYLPGSQLLQAVAPKSEYLPSGQFRQWVDALPVEYVPAQQSSHTSVPTTLELQNWPGSHAWQVVADTDPTAW